MRFRLAALPAIVLALAIAAAACSEAAEPTQPPAPTATTAPASTATTAPPAATATDAPPTAPTRPDEPTPPVAPAATPTIAPTPTATATPADTPSPTVAHLPTDAPIPTATPIPEPTATPTDEPTPTATAVPEPTATLTATPVPVSPIDAAFERFNRERQALGLGTFTAAVAGDDSYISFQTFDAGCEASVSEYAELQVEDLHAVSMTVIQGISECGLRVVLHHYVPLEQRMRVSQSVWDCFTESRDIREASDISCGGRFTFLGRHVKWLPGNVLYTIVEGEAHRSKFTAHISWMEEKLNVTVSEAPSGQRPDLYLHLGVESPANCPERYGCNVTVEDEFGAYSTIYISAPDEYFSQVLKHELLHALLPMGHLPQGDYLMSVRPPDPTQTHTLSALEEKLLALYTHPYLRNNMTMDKFRRYLVIE